MNSIVERPGFDFGLRLGYAIPFGDAFSGSGLNDTLSGGIPFVLEAGYRFTPNITAGALFQYAFAQVKDTTGGCGNGVSCSGSVVRLGIQGLYNFRMGTALDPWVGLGIGYEWANVDASAGGQTASASLSGLEFLTLQGGGDYRLMPQMSLGPFLSFSVARYGSQSTSAPGVPSTSQDIASPAIHEWLQLGIRGTFSI